MSRTWHVHIEGPDDVIPMPSEQAAIDYAAKLNARAASWPKHPYDPHIHAVVICDGRFPEVNE